MSGQDIVDNILEEKQFAVLIVDDERLARTLLEDYVSKLPILHLVASCANAMDAMALMQQEKIDILLTDIEMPEMTGVEFVENLPYKPSIIFTTAYSQYAIDAYDLGVVDYLLKPIAFNRFVKAVNKAIARVKLINTAAKVSLKADGSPAQTPVPVPFPVSALTPSQTVEKQQDYMMVRADRKLYRVKFSDLLYVEGQQEYVTFHTKQRNITAFYSLKNLMEELPQDQFIRIHRSYIVSLSHVEIVDVSSVTVAGVELPVGPSYRESVMDVLGM